MVALAVSGMAIATTMRPMAMAMIQAGACRSFSTVDSWSARPRSASTLEAENAATMVMTNETGRRSIVGAVITFATAADGKTLTRLDARDRAVVTTPASGTTPERKISANTLVATLGEEGIVTSERDNNLRISAHCYNTVEDVDLVLAALQRNRSLLA